MNQSSESSIESLKAITIVYNIYADDLPMKAPRSEWKKESKFGFLKGIITYGKESHTQELNNMLSTKSLEVVKRLCIDIL